MPDRGSHWLAQRLAYLRDTVWGHKMRDVFPCPKFNPKAEVRRKPRDEEPFPYECRMALCNFLWFSDLSRLRKELYRELVVGSASDTLVKRLSWSLGEIRSQRNWAPGSSFLNNSKFSLTGTCCPSTTGLSERV